MRMMFRLARVLFKAGGGLDGSSFGGRRKKRLGIGRAGTTVLLACCFLPMGFLIYTISVAMYSVMAPMGEGEMLLQFANALSAFLTAMFGVYYVASSLYFSEDNRYLLALPFTPSQVAGARFLNLLFYEYVVTLVVWIPYIVYGVMSRAGALYYLFALLSYAALPVIPLAVCALLVMLLMRLLPFFRNKDVFTIVSTSLLMVGMVTFSLSMSGAMSSIEEGAAISLSANMGLLRASAYLFPGISFSAKAMAGAGTFASLGSMLLYLLCNCAAFALFLLLARVFYLRAVTSASGTSRRKLSVEKQRGPRPAFAALLLREWRLLTRSPISLLNCVAVNFLWPVFLGISVFGGRMSGDGGGMLASLISGISWQQPSTISLTLCVCFAASMFLGATNLVSTTAISREGGVNLAMLLTLPVSLYTQALAKIAMGVILGVCALIVMLILVLALMGMPVWLACAGLLVSLCSLCAINLIGFMVDLHNPRVHWENEQQAIKQNLNGVYVIFGGLALGSVIAVAGYFLAGGSPFVVFIALVALGALLTLFMTRWLRRVIDPWARAIEL